MRFNDMDITTPEHISLRFKLAGLGSRATAIIFDTLILLIFQLALTFLVLHFIGFFQLTSGYILAFFSLITFFLWWGYFVLFEFFSAGKTLGKMIMNIRVIQENGQNVTFLSALIRNLIRLVDFMPVLYLLGILLIFFHPKHKRLGDLASGTIVIHGEKNVRKRRWEKRIETTLVKRGIDPYSLTLDEGKKRRFKAKEWQLLKTYLERRFFLSPNERNNLTLQIGEILLPIMDIQVSEESIEKIENQLFLLYFQLRADWDYGF